MATLLVRLYTMLTWMVLMGLLVGRVRLVQLAQQEQLEPQVRLVQQELLELQVQLVLQVLQELLALQEPLVQLELQVLQV